ncbi:MAG: hypothetical protein JW969_20190 [Spirochaetales bacterium]|nr:hypothetical protein [Spirochaetales bacterium]
MADLPDLYVTLWPTLPHFSRFAKDYRLTGIRLNSAMIQVEELDDEFAVANAIADPVPLYFDIKGRQLRVTEVIPCKDHLELTLNHPISVQTPVMVLFKGGEDCALLEKVVDGTHLIFEGGPEYNVYEGESLHIRHPSLRVQNEVLCDYEVQKINKARAAGFSRWFLSYVESENDIRELREHVGDDLIIAKIENRHGLEYVEREFKVADNYFLMAACGDLYVEVEKPHHIMAALKLIIEKDPQAFAGSRMLLSLVQKPVPSLADLLHLGWLYDHGYRRFLLCDELCLKEELLASAINVFESFKSVYS